MKSRLIIVEDHRILREGLRAMLCSNPDFDIVGEAENGMDAVRCARQYQPDLMLIDLSMPKMDGLDAISEIKNISPNTRILVLTVHKAEEYVFAALKAGANGYLLKDATHNELRLAVENVLAGKTYISPGISERLVQYFLNGRKDPEPDTALDILTQRERQILKLIAEGNKNKGISDYLCISIKTVEKHRSNLMKKLDLHNASELTAFAIQKGLVTK
ncbi:Two component system response regulator, LuxR domain-containing [Desulfonema limicola]|uniref:Two component system response regulator, LuxR domain-containing n=1 Tax=Desulfonema limicola TaxID=45656 RepID=A0A975BDI9_9BACT|nr:response regulator transcription factor [Desulfonema limicola]QTA83527.1 Two component system response regulator, LuxR domain-containing [Desulfonema limicola]